MIPTEDKLELLRLLRIVNPNNNDMNSIYNMYKKYIYEKAIPFTLGCNSCPGSIVKYWKELGEFYNKIK